MRNYVIINGVNSLTIQGLAINNLPPITKPMIRTQREEIDGRDGDIVTELGYSAYDKSMEIGLYGNFDIDEIIKFFTGEGTIVFSNEADKYYNFKILDQIDYEKLLKFKTATVTFHCQPFKYPLEEEPLEAEITTITGTGETITLEDIEEAPMKIVYKGNTYQNGEPTPDTPIPIQVVSGDNSIEICGKNLASDNFNDYYLNGSYLMYKFNKGTNNCATSISDKDTSVDISGCYLGVSTEDSSGIVWLVQNGNISRTQWNDSMGSLLRPYLIIYPNNQTTFNKLFARFNIMSENGTSFSTYEPYIGASYPINLPVENLVEGIIEKENINSSGLLLIDNSFDMHIAKVVQGETYTITSNDINNGFVGGFFTSYPANNTYSYNNQRVVSNSWTFTAPITGYVVFRSQTGYQYAQLERGTKRNTYTPYGTTPIRLGRIPNTDYGNKIDKSTGKNLVNINGTSRSVTNNYYITEPLNKEITSDMVGKKYSLSFTLKVNTLPSGVGFYYNIGYGATGMTAQIKSISVSSPSATTYNCKIEDIEITQAMVGNNLYFRPMGYSSQQTFSYEFSEVMLNEGNTALPYEPYGTGWYLKKEIGKVVLNGSETWYLQTESVGQFKTLIAPLVTQNNGYSNYFIVKTTYTESGKPYLRLNNGIIWGEMGTNFLSEVSVSALQTWLSTHNTELYYVLATPTYTEITGELLNQLEAIKMSYEGQTNLSQTNNDLPFELDASVTFLTPMEINNIGNIYAKPILTIEGTGNIGVILNDIQILEIDLSNNGKITIDVPKLEAYNPDDDSLLNRLVTGDYMKLLINEGENKITFTGEVSVATLTNYIRWI